MIFSLFRSRSTRVAARDIYGEIIAQARQPLFYEGLGVPDSVEGRFDLLVLHSFLVMGRLKGKGGADTTEGHFANKIFSTMVEDLDSNLRELGVGDLTVGKKVRGLTEAFLGRAASYDEALKTKDSELMARVVARNILGDELLATSDKAKSLSAYVFAVNKELTDQSAERLMQGVVVFPALTDFLPNDDNGNNDKEDG
jgi:cytochrome b pre-mRNA-processing protein 3